MVTIGRSTDFAAAFADARGAGFGRGQVNVAIHGVTAEEVRQIAVAAHEAEFTVDAVGCYMNPLRMADPDAALPDGSDWKTLAANMGMMNGVERLVCWSGTLSKSLGAPNLLNQEEDAFNRLFVTLHGLLEQIRGLPVRIILEPYTTHVLSDARSCLRMAQKFPGGEVRVVLDGPNVVAAADFGARDARVQEFATEVAPAVGLIHLKDLGRDAAGHRAFLPAGRGTLSYAPYLRAIAQHVPEVPAIIEGAPTVAETRQARLFVEGVLKEYRL